jgi:hypothetical protein
VEWDRCELDAGIVSSVYPSLLIAHVMIYARVNVFEMTVLEAIAAAVARDSSLKVLCG